MPQALPLWRAFSLICPRPEQTSPSSHIPTHSVQPSMTRPSEKITSERRHLSLFWTPTALWFYPRTAYLLFSCMPSPLKRIILPSSTIRVFFIICHIILASTLYYRFNKDLTHLFLFLSPVVLRKHEWRPPSTTPTPRHSEQHSVVLGVRFWSWTSQFKSPAVPAIY